MKKEVIDTHGKKLKVTIRSKEKLLFSGFAQTLSSVNERGPFDILVGHTNFICLISGYVVIDNGLETEQKFQLDKGVAYVVADEVDIYIGI